ncbi:3-isopropylmalate dehydratase large subunit [Desulfallas sp. Bu1-1]|uniref:3-isopropylmalate dehydratase large subunit n=1 Tax=Desulfallas sp. Bu1-1 TaxID=2787620 RepID=UPI00189C9876|nr:3-isopropylmalate dehydratase large subunit [Desulfallas sp. Bu1-1]MBF7084611.1 3-isopropylmalate dehydratase large subunit [Desulfallas sp. Bu1-1]
MGMTLVEKVLAQAANLPQVKPGQFITAKVDKIIGHDISLAAFRELERMGATRVFDPDRIAITWDHFVPSPTVGAANQNRELAGYINRYKIKNFFEVGRGGICHALFPEKGLIWPGDVVVGSDSHTCTYGALGAVAMGMGSTDVAAAMALGEVWLKVPETIRVHFAGERGPWTTGKDLILYTLGQIGTKGALYKALEFAGEAVYGLNMDERFTICNMAVEGGSKTAVIAPDDTTREYLVGRVPPGAQLRFYSSDLDAVYVADYIFDCSKIEPQVACPPSPANVHPAAGLTGVKIDQAVLGSCTNGRLSDLRVAARILEGRKIKPGVRMIVVPGTQEIYLTAMREGLLETFVRAGALVSPPTCGPCFGGHMGLLGDSEVAISSTNRNFTGRMGAVNSQVYLASPATVAASAITGYICDPREVMSA